MTLFDLGCRLLACTLATLALSVAAQPHAYPGKLVRVIVPVTAGGNVERIARATAQTHFTVLCDRVNFRQVPCVSNREGTQTQRGLLSSYK